MARPPAGPGLGAACLVAMVLFLWPSPAFAGAKPADLFGAHVESDRYDLYAPAQKDLDKAKAVLDETEERFHRFMGEYPPKLTVAVLSLSRTESNRKIPRVGRKEIPYFEWKSPDYLSSGEKAPVEVPDLELTAETRSDGSGVYISWVEPASLPDDRVLRAGDVVTALNDVVVKSDEDLIREIEKVEPLGEMRIALRRYGEPLVIVRHRPGKVPYSPRAANARALYEASLSSAAARFFVYVFAESRFGIISSNWKSDLSPETFFRGVQWIPDWFEEALGGLCSGPQDEENRKRMLAAMRSKMAARHPIGTLVTMDEPVTASIAASAGRMRWMLNGGDQIDPKTFARALGEAMEKWTLFDLESQAFAYYLIEKEGDSVMGRLGKAYVEGSKFSQILPTLNSLPPKVEDLDKAWAAWLEERAGSPPPKGPGAVN